MSALSRGGLREDETIHLATRTLDVDQRIPETLNRLTSDVELDSMPSLARNRV